MRKEFALDEAWEKFPELRELYADKADYERDMRGVSCIYYYEEEGVRWLETDAGEILLELNDTESDN